MSVRVRGTTWVGAEDEVLLGASVGDSVSGRATAGAAGARAGDWLSWV